ncbi:MAG: nucleotide exchange factor GrpE [Anaerolineales bacterium]|nr:nucleotide exchange factor GrpE [Anaerolineales bacterium]
MKIPIRVQSAAPRRSVADDIPPVSEGAPVVEDRTERTHIGAATQSVHPTPETAAATNAAAQGQGEPAAEQRSQGAGEDQEDWRDQTMRLRADMENYRKRQQRLADLRITEDRERLLNAFLAIADDLERALAAASDDAGGLQQGVELTYRKLMGLLKKEGVEPVEAIGQPFDPSVHEAVGTVPRSQRGVHSHTVVEVKQTGYRLDGRLLRPARVIVAV